MSIGATAQATPPGSAKSASPIRTLRNSDAAVLTAMLLSLGLLYIVPGLISAAVGGVIFFALAIYRPNLSLATVPCAAPLFYRQRAFELSSTRTLNFSLAEVIVLICVAAWVVREAIDMSRRPQGERLTPILQALRGKASLLRQPVVWLAVAFLLIGVLWLFIPPNIIRNIALREFRVTVLEPVLFLALILRWIRTPADVWRLVGAWLVTSALVGREAVEQFLFGEAALMEGVGRATSIFPSATALGIYLGKALPLAVVLAFLLPPAWRFWRAAAALLSIAIGLGVIASFARGAWIGVAVALAIVAFIARNRRMLIGLAAAFVAGLAALPFINVTRITSMFDFNTEDNTGVARAKIWASALKIIGDHPFTGIGQDQFLYQDPKYGVPQLRLFTISHPHNWVLDFWLRLGLPGLLWLLATLIYFFRQTYTLWAKLRGTATGALLLGLMASMIDFAVHGLLDMAYFTMDSALTFWLTFGLVTILQNQHDTSKSLSGKG
ncbi:MAG: O-antigen ligase family protein [Chloroflexia bacterium]